MGDTTSWLKNRVVESGQHNSEFYIRTYTGRKFYFNTLEKNDYVIEDIAHALSNNCRWTGHTCEFYSVAEHCIACSRICQPKGKIVSLGALLHDACEAYVHDTPGPLKAFLTSKGFTAFAELEHGIDAHIFNAFDIPYPMDAEIKRADKLMLADEWDNLIANKNELGLMACWTPEIAERKYLERYYELTS